MRNEAVTTNDTRTVHGRRETRRKKNGRPPSTRKKDRKKPLYSELEEKQAMGFQWFHIPTDSMA